MTIDRRHLLAAAAIALPTVAAVRARAETDGERWAREWEERLHSDWPYLARYRDENAALIAAGTPVRTVFMGDSITQGWRDKRPGFFVPGRVGRGIGGQTTGQMVLRMMADVIALKPKAVHIMAGTNDIAGNTGPMTPEMSIDNFAMMADLAKAHGIRVLLASVPPAAGFPWRPGLETVPKIADLNRRLRALAAQKGATYVDYHPVLATPAGGMKPGLASDGVHPTEAGYDAMATVIEPVLKRLRLA